MEKWKVVLSISCLATIIIVFDYKIFVVFHIITTRFVHVSLFNLTWSMSRLSVFACLLLKYGFSILFSLQIDVCDYKQAKPCDIESNQNEYCVIRKMIYTMRQWKTKYYIVCIASQIHMFVCIDFQIEKLAISKRKQTAAM